RTMTFNHVLPGRVPASAVMPGQPITTVQGGVFKIESAGGLKVTDGRNRVASITTTDVAASNGLIHVLDRVLLPADKDIVATAQGAADLSILVEAVVAAGLVSTLQGAGPFTVFAPTNAAFASLLAELGITKSALLADKALLTRVLTYHVVPARVLKAAVPIGSPITTVQGESITVNSALQITDRRGRTAAITATDIFASNGVVHLIDKVILPSA
ncbi:MAG: fasciclin domain-containing protein, partial [Burkholderiales bacterium]